MGGVDKWVYICNIHVTQVASLMQIQVGQLFLADTKGETLSNKWREQMGVQFVLNVALRSLRFGFESPSANLFQGVPKEKRSIMNGVDKWALLSKQCVTQVTSWLVQIPPP